MLKIVSAYDARARMRVPVKNCSRTHQFAQVAFKYISNIVNSKNKMSATRAFS